MQGQDPPQQAMPLITPQQAEEAILSHFPVASVESISIHDAYHRVLREPILSDRAIPPFHRVMMDGIGIQFPKKLDDSLKFQIQGVQAAGSPALELQSPLHCLEVMTGATAPIGVDCVIPVENIEISDDGSSRTARVLDWDNIQAGSFIHSMGADAARGAELLPTGTTLAAPELATAASCGYTHVQVSKIPHIHLLTSGDEVVPIDQSPETHQIRASHPIALRTSLESKKLATLTHHHLPDDPAATEAAICSSLATADMLILTGGISKGQFDFIAPILKKLCGDPEFHGVAQRPGKPFAFHLKPIPIFALPGNPLSVMACTARYVIPALRQHLATAFSPPQLPPVAVYLNPFPRTQILAAQMIDGRLLPASPKNSGEYTATHHCSGVVQIPPHQSPINTELPFYPW
ncbi:molybdopterin molybdotransferase MoeA [Rubritalea marina]|uniref:molybdopterin molybdotransferase MoeA n=1 Tax=Rubritalea marina TaxID=361055 RepID=UPI00037E4E7C|nr:molybdopterin molybdotransferase MoeA [Rubritalea marina]